MLRTSAAIAVGLCLLLLPLHIIAAPQSQGATAPIRIPKPGEGYDIAPPVETSQAAPAGYEGRTDTSILTAVGNTPATMGKRIVARFKLGNQIRTCPTADGIAEGRGEFSMSVDYTHTQASGINTVRIEMKAVGKYKGQVGDDAWLENPVNAEVDYTYTQTGSMREPGGPIATPAGSNVAQQITIPFGVSRGLDAPTFGAFAGGDPTQGRYAEAAGAGAALVYWAGVYYAVAQTRWRQEGRCVNVDFKPPSYTVRLVPGASTTVGAEVKTKAGETVKARFHDARARSGATVSPPVGPSPMPFTFTAPTQRVTTAGFAVNATSRAGIAEGEWWAGLGPDWSGRITYTVTESGDQGENELQTWSNSSVSRLTVDVRNGKATVTGYREVHYLSVRRQPALRGGAKTIIFESSDMTDGSYEETVPAAVEVVSSSPGTYGVRVSQAFKGEGKARTEICNRSRPCTSSDQQLLLPTLAGIDGKTDDPNRLSGSKTDTRTGAGYQGSGTVTSVLTWNLSREGSSR
jgi:hypothetical protein